MSREICFTYTCLYSSFTAPPLIRHVKLVLIIVTISTSSEFQMLAEATTQQARPCGGGRGPGGVKQGLVLPTPGDSMNNLIIHSL